MTAKTDALPPRRDRAHERNVEWLAERSDERLLLVWACGLAVFLHGLAFLIDLPEPRVSVPPPDPQGPVIHVTPLPPPPPPDARPPTPVDTSLRTPIPDREPESPEPVREPTLEIPEVGAIEAEIDVAVAAPVAPPAPPTPDGPVPIGPNIEQPVLIEESKVPPVYPKLARVARLPGDVIVQAVIRRDGSVGEVTVLRCKPPGLGFEEAAIEAVQQWRYEPARQFGVPIEVYFTVYVNFELR